MSTPAPNLRQFQLKSVLNENTYSKSVVLLGTLPSEASSNGSPTEPALLIVEKLPFTQAEAERLVTERLGETSTTGKNDIYHWLRGRLREQLGQPEDDGAWDIKLTIICPATETHIRKYQRQVYRMVRETPAIYQQVVLPYIEQLPTSRIQWVYNILDGISEQEDVLLSDSDPKNGFVILPDSKWDRRTTENLYLLCLCRNRKLRSLRDLRAEHLPLLVNIRKQAARVASQQYGVAANQLRMFFHYQPSYYHLHVHIVHIQHEQFSGMVVGQAHLLEDVIDAIRLESGYFEKRVFTYPLGEQHPLYALLEEAGAMQTHDDNML